MYMNFDDKLKLAGKVFSLVGWAISIYFSAQGFGLKADTGYLVAGYFLALLVTLCEIFLGRFGSKMPRVLVGLCLLATGYGVATNIVGILAGRGGIGMADYAIAIALGIVLELYPERLYMFVSGVQSADLWEAVQSLGGGRQNRPQARAVTPPTYRNRPLHPENPRRNNHHPCP